MWKRFSALWTLVRRDGRLLWFALRHPDAPRWLRPATFGLVLYAISPIDLIPDFIPVLGLMDDVVLIPLAVHFILKCLPPHVLRQAEARAGARTVRAG
ncbi:YkvA family protein [Cupriavidus basilensis]|uniref:YkvA family protein n=1 Tax=Cupriavidus basilensis TaxID=68895 RepID=A0ABT6ATB6_9BURK|nr:YkvA family protein [Cupriavidus basilensis]MDF3835618.1 YkvA family protein [Cupriavidus basilensis]